MKSFIDKIKTHPYIISQKQDLLWFILMPVIAVFLIASGFNWLTTYRGFDSAEQLHFMVTVIVQLHLFSVFYRAYNNPTIWSSYKNRFIITPIVLFSMLFVSTPMLYFLSMVAILWDSYHKGAQDFGIGRIYDAKLGSDPQVGRKLDLSLNMFIHYFPLLWGLHNPELFQKVFNEGGRTSNETTMITDLIINYMLMVREYLPWVTAAFFLFYVYQYRKIVKMGYQISVHKILFFTITFICNLWIWNISGPLAALVAINFGHSIQYIAITWYAENKNLEKLFSTTKLIAFCLFILTGLTYGLLVTNTTSYILARVSLGVALLHYFYDGFIWSTRKKQI